MTESLETLRYRTAQELFAALPEIGEDMEARPRRDESVMVFARGLLDGPAPEEAVTAAAQMFVRRVAVWWGHECLRHVGDRLDPADLEMMERVAAWVAQPDESARAAMLDAAMACEIRSPGIWLALGAGWGGASLTPPDSPPVSPPRFPDRARRQRRRSRRPRPGAAAPTTGHAARFPVDGAGSCSPRPGLTETR